MKQIGFIYEPKDRISPAEKVLAVLEFFSRNGAASFGLSEAASSLKMPKASLLRILNALCRRGYLFRSTGKNYRRNFTLDKLSASDLSLLEPCTQKLAAEIQQTVEILTVSSNYLYWAVQSENNTSPVRVQAKTGSRRTLYEIDAPVRIWLKNLGIIKIKEQFGLHAFYHPDFHKSRIEAAKILKILSVPQQAVEYDKTGNTNGIRRYAAALKDSKKNLIAVLSVAEPALEQNLTIRHEQFIIQAIKKIIKKMQEVIYENDLH
ncbi:MAG: hypothetical protein A2096_04745 [Spirochaetes bacterium GWF1_41_5]|nr:MAG: hypothetical protein A2096_04745 [Spirochaetes bacterium GWF1_41_5]HBE03391.1 hypothetical protein [Spirochaetia bacterium]